MTNKWLTYDWNFIILWLRCDKIIKISLKNSFNNPNSTLYVCSFINENKIKKKTKNKKKNKKVIRSHLI